MDISNKQVVECLKKYNLICPICAHNAWDGSYEKDLMVQNKHLGESGTSPLLLLICEECGYTMLFSKIIATRTSLNEKGEIEPLLYRELKEYFKEQK